MLKRSRMRGASTELISAPALDAPLLAGCSRGGSLQTVGSLHSSQYEASLKQKCISAKALQSERNGKVSKGVKRIPFVVLYGAQGIALGAKIPGQNWPRRSGLAGYPRGRSGGKLIR